MRKFTESVNIDIFDDVDRLIDILSEYKDDGFEYKIYYHMQRSLIQSDGSWGDIFPVRLQDVNFFNDVNKEKGEFKSYVIRFLSESNIFKNSDIITSDFQRSNRKAFGVPSSNFYKFASITKHVQDRIESMNCTFTISLNEGDIDIMIIEGKHK